MEVPFLEVGETGESRPMEETVGYDTQNVISDQNLKYHAFSCNSLERDTSFCLFLVFRREA